MPRFSAVRRHGMHVLRRHAAFPTICRRLIRSDIHSYHINMIRTLRGDRTAAVRNSVAYATRRRRGISQARFHCNGLRCTSPSGPTGDAPVFAASLQIPTEYSLPVCKSLRNTRYRLAYAHTYRSGASESAGKHSFKKIGGRLIGSHSCHLL